jgi:uracil-DNA glycosylase
MRCSSAHPVDAAGATLEAVRATALGCTHCELAHLGRTHVVFGSGRHDADVFVIGEAPGAQEDESGEPFVGRSGQLLTRLIESAGMARRDVYIANVVKCRPPDNRNPLPAEIAACSPWLDRQLQLVMPKIIVTLGNFATRLILDTKDGITKLRGQEFAVSRAGIDAIVIPTLHPSAVLRNGRGALDATRQDFEFVHRRLRAAQR